MVEQPDFDEFLRQLDLLRRDANLKGLIRNDVVRLTDLTLDQIAALMRGSAGFYFLMAAANLTRTTLRRAQTSPAAQIVAPKMRKVFALKQHLPVQCSFRQVVQTAATLRRADLGRKSRGSVEGLFRERLKSEGIPVLMSPPVRQVPGLLIGKRKPDGVWPDPTTNAAPRLYLEIKNVRRVSDDIQKRLYEVAEASLEMKLLYGGLSMSLPGVRRPSDVAEQSVDLRARLGEQIRGALPVVVVLLLCAREQAERYRSAAEAFVDRVFFEDEIEECLLFLKEATGHTG